MSGTTAQKFANILVDQNADDPCFDVVIEPADFLQDVKTALGDLGFHVTCVGRDRLTISDPNRTGK